MRLRWNSAFAMTGVFLHVHLRPMISRAFNKRGITAVSQLLSAIVHTIKSIKTYNFLCRVTIFDTVVELKRKCVEQSSFM